MIEAHKPTHRGDADGDAFGWLNGTIQKGFGDVGLGSRLGSALSSKLCFILNVMCELLIVYLLEYAGADRRGGSKAHSLDYSFPYFSFYNAQSVPVTVSGIGKQPKLMMSVGLWELTELDGQGIDLG
uniref:Uncharacterized protein n=1 Tax=Ditylenchus dipsaci TaxID=166011 RepID=A0A915CYH9_9BILA